MNLRRQSKKYPPIHPSNYFRVYKDLNGVTHIIKLHTTNGPLEPPCDNGPNDNSVVRALVSRFFFSFISITLINCCTFFSVFDSDSWLPMLPTYSWASHSVSSSLHCTYISFSCVGVWQNERPRKSHNSFLCLLLWQRTSDRRHCEKTKSPCSEPSQHVRSFIFFVMFYIFWTRTCHAAVMALTTKYLFLRVFGF